MASTDGDRARFFPAIEKKHGGKISQWIDRVKSLGDAKYPEQVAFLREEHGFSQAHANALVMYVRGSATSKRHSSPAAYFRTVDTQAATTMKAIFDAITSKHPDFELVIAWNQPILRNASGYVIGLSASKNHITINPFSGDAIDKNSTKLAKFVVNKKTFQVPLDWKVQPTLLHALVRVRLSEIRTAE
jgi:uncharacterized protein YdhG (YjbR/CyaY superfamily)